ncbi:MAG: hypothetical protein K2N47_05410, partial [Clostridia bacterium]|nr:hypothetical protein [Clostridia bacterium]
MKKICSKNLLKLLLAVAFAVTLIAGIFAVGGTAAYASPTNDETIDFGTDGITIEDQSKVNELITILGGTSYDDLSTKLDSAKDASNFVSAKTVTLGGVEFIIAYVSKADYTANGTNEGEIIVTLWMAESDIESKWSNVVSNTPEDDYPTNMYSSSLIRSTLVGTPYLTAIGAETLEGTGEINAAWQPFNNGGAFYDYLATPANMAWQETLSAVDTGVYTLNSNNEAWGTISGEVQGGYDYSSKDGYADWQNDSIWLPALSEVGNKNSSMGLWKTNQVQKSNTIDSWLRTGYSAHVAWFVYSTGNSDSRSVVNSRAVRPAVHL